MPQQNTQILFMEMDSWSDQWAHELLKYTRPSPAPLTALPGGRLETHLISGGEKLKKLRHEGHRKSRILRTAFRLIHIPLIGIRTNSGNLGKF